MTEGIEHIGRKSVAWSYVAVLFNVGAGVILLPFILHQLPAESVAIWGVFQAIYSMTILMDFGFRPSFARNLSYIFSGVTELQRDGISGNKSETISFSLLKATINAMKRFYRYLSACVLLLLLTAGTAYFMYLMQKYSGDRTEASVAWFLLCAINCYNLYTLYYDSLLTGKGYITKLQQITILGQSVYILTAVVLLYTGYGLVAIVAAQTLSIFIKRYCAYRTFYTPQLRTLLVQAPDGNPSAILRIIAPNSIKVGLTSLGGYLVNKSSLFIGSLYLSLEDIAVYTITIQVLDILARCGSMLYVTFSPRIAQCRTHGDIPQMGRLYALSVLALLSIYIVGGGVMLLLGNNILTLIGSQTQLLPQTLLLLLLIVSLLEQNHSIAAGFIQAGNEIPFFIPSLLSGTAVVILLWAMLHYTQFGLLALIIAPGIVQLLYNNWKWPSVVIGEIRHYGR